MKLTTTGYRVVPLWPGQPEGIPPWRVVVSARSDDGERWHYEERFDEDLEPDELMHVLSRAREAMTEKERQ